MPVNGRAKGARGERELADELNRLGLLARRSVQYSGKSGEAADLIVVGLAAHVECKRTEVIRLDKWLEQVEADSRGRPWIIVMKQNRRPWLVVQTLEHWVADSRDAERAASERMERITQALADAV